MQAIRQSSDQQHAHLREMNQRIGSLQLEIAKLQAEREKTLEVAAEHERSTAKGRPYEEAVFDAIDAIAGGAGDDCDAVGDLPGVGGRKGDVLVAIDGCSGSPRGRIVFEAKNARVAKKVALADLDEAMAHRDAAYGIWVVPSEEQLPARVQPLREINGDKLFVVYDPEQGRQGLQLAYLLARARILMARGEAEGLDTTAVRGELERAQGALEEGRRIRQQLTIATNGVGRRPRDPRLDGAAREGPPRADRGRCSPARDGARRGLKRPTSRALAGWWGHAHPPAARLRPPHRRRRARRRERGPGPEAAQARGRRRSRPRPRRSPSRPRWR